ncbi:MAG TPA: Ig-like domain repeat protein, partial [Acidimicrobiales bacterium]|nr:Ig-like domain repeat protein [Acidimicrobiales bacterium]
MRQRLTSIILALALLLPALVVLTEAPASATGFSNTASIALTAPVQGDPGCNGTTCDAKASPYPSTITVGNLSGTVSNVSVTLNNASFSYANDLDVLLVGPTGASLILVADMGPTGGTTAALAGSTTTFSDSGSTPTMTTAWGTGNTFKPSNFSGRNEVFLSPAPSSGYGNPGPDTTIGPAGATFATQFNGTNPTGTWSLYVVTTTTGDGTGAIAGGWTLNITTAVSAAPTTTKLTSAPNPSFTSGASSSVLLTATVTSTSSVNEGTVNFTDGGATISGCGAQPVSSGTATCTTTFTAEGNHSVEALYGGTSNFGASNATLTQQVNDQTTVTGSSYCNTGAVTLNNSTSGVADASPYPSHIFVSGLGGAVSHLTVSLNGVTFSQSQDIDALLVGPGGQNLILVAHVGPDNNGAISNVTLTVDDSASSTLPAGSIWGAPNTSVTSKPVNYGGLNETFAPPAPPSPYGNPGPSTDNGTVGATLGSQFNGTDGNGTWSLYLITTIAGDGAGSVGHGWCVNIATANVAGTNTSITSSQNPSFTTAPGNSVTFTAAVTKASDSSNVSEGTVDFTDNGATISGCGAEAVTAGMASCTTTFSTEGSSTIEALYSGTTNFGPSHASLTQGVNDHTTVTGNSFCNTGSITLNNPTQTNIPASPYPSNIFVSGRGVDLLHLSVTLSNVSYKDSQDIDALLVGPGGQSLILVAAAGPNSGGALGHVTLTVDDNASTTLSNTAAWGAASSTVTSKPVNYGGNNEVFPAPAPSGTYGNPGPSGSGTATLGSTYDGTNPNGTWSLYVITTLAGDGTGAIAGGWCLGVTTPAPPTVTKAFGASSVLVNGSTSLSFTVTNPNSSNTLTGIGFTDPLPSGLVLSTPAGETGSCGGGTITAADGGTAVSLSGATLAGNATCTFSVNVTGINAGSQVNTTSTISSNEGGAGTAATATLVVMAPPSLSKAFGASSIVVGNTTSLTFTVTNPNTAGTLSGIGFNDTLPTGLIVATPNGETFTCNGTITATAGSGSVSLSGETLEAGGSCTFSVMVTGTAVGSQVNTTSVVTSNEGGTGSAATATLMVTAAPPTINKSFGAASIPLNGSTSLSFTITNPSGNGSQSGIAFTDTLPAGLEVSTPNGESGACGGGTITATAGSGTVGLTGATLADGASCTFSVNVTGTAAGVLDNSVTVSSTNGGTGNTSNASITVVAPPTVTKAFGTPMIALNGTTSLTFTVTNPNTATTLTGIGFTDTFPAGLVVASPANGESGTCGGGTITADAGSGSVSLSGATLAATATCTFSVNVTGATAGSKVNTTSVVASNEGGSGAAATATLDVAAGPPTIDKSFGAASIPLGGSTTLSFTITNPTANGTSTGIGFTDSLPSGLVVSTPNSESGSCGGGSITAAAGSASVGLSGAT